MITALIFICMVGAATCDDDHSVWNGRVMERFLTNEECQVGAVEYLHKHIADFGGVLKRGQQYQFAVECSNEKL